MLVAPDDDEPHDGGDEAAAGGDDMLEAGERLDVGDSPSPSRLTAFFVVMTSTSRR